MRASARVERYDEEIVKLVAEVGMATRFFQYQAKLWDDRAMVHPEDVDLQTQQGFVSYARKKAAGWRVLAVSLWERCKTAGMVDGPYP